MKTPPRKPAAIPRRKVQEFLNHPKGRRCMCSYWTASDMLEDSITELERLLKPTKRGKK